MLLPHQRDDAKVIAELLAKITQLQTDVQRLQKLLDRMVRHGTLFTVKPGG